jgi:hypothetical protein
MKASDRSESGICRIKDLAWDPGGTPYHLTPLRARRAVHGAFSHPNCAPTAFPCPHPLLRGDGVPRKRIASHPENIGQIFESASGRWVFLAGAESEKPLILSQPLGFESEIDLTYLGALKEGKRNPSLLIMVRIANALAVVIWGNPKYIHLRAEEET